MPRRISGSGSGKHVAPGGSTQPFPKHVGLTHGPQIMHKGQHRRITHRNPQTVRDRQSKSGTLHQTTKVADFPHRGHAWAQSSGQLHFCLGQGLPKLTQCFSAEEHGNQQSIRAQGAAALDQLTYRIIRPMQPESMDDKIKALRLETQNLRIGNLLPMTIRRGQVPCPDTGTRSNDSTIPESPVHRRQPLLNLVSRPVMEKIRGTLPDRTIASQHEGIPVEERQRLMHPDTPGRGSRSHLPIAATLDRLRASLIDTLYPPRCLACSEPTDAPHGLCPTCWRDTDFIAGPACRSCGLPLLGEAGPDDICETCERHPPAWNRGSAAFLYRGAGRSMVLAFKHGDRLDLTRPLARWMAQRGQPLLEAADMIAPVPLHWRRLLKRRYNQSAELAKALSALSGTTAVLDLLSRSRSTGSQEGRNRNERFSNQAGAFRVPARHMAQIQGKHILLVDDVLTTGATLTACTEALSTAGAKQVDVIVAARVAFGDSLHI